MAACATKPQPANRAPVPHHRSIAIPLLGSLSVSTVLMASLAAATSVRCGSRIVGGLLPELRALLRRPKPEPRKAE